MSADKDRLRELMMAALDGECSDADRQRLDDALASDQSLRSEWTELKHVKEVTAMMRIRKPPDEVWNEYWGSVYARLERGIAWVFISVGAIVLLSYALWQSIQELIADTQVPGFVKLAIAAVAIGAVILVVSVVREKWFTWRNDPYKDIER